MAWFGASLAATALLWGLVAWGTASNTQTTNESFGSVSEQTGDRLCARLGNTPVLASSGNTGVASLDVMTVRSEQNVPGLSSFLRGMSDSTPVVECDFGDLGHRTCDGKARYLVTADGKRTFTYPCGYRTPFYAQS